jgi:hypothetical protein
VIQVLQKFEREENQVEYGRLATFSWDLEHHHQNHIRFCFSWGFTLKAFKIVLPNKQVEKLQVTEEGQHHLENELLFLRLRGGILYAVNSRYQLTLYSLSQQQVI